MRTQKIDALEIEAINAIDAICDNICRVAETRAVVEYNRMKSDLKRIDRADTPAEVKREIATIAAIEAINCWL